MPVKNSGIIMGSTVASSSTRFASFSPAISVHLSKTVIEVHPQTLSTAGGVLCNKYTHHWQVSMRPACGFITSSSVPADAVLTFHARMPLLQFHPTSPPSRTKCSTTHTCTLVTHARNWQCLWSPLCCSCHCHYMLHPRSPPRITAAPPTHAYSVHANQQRLQSLLCWLATAPTCCALLLPDARAAVQHVPL